MRNLTIPHVSNEVSASLGYALFFFILAFPAASAVLPVKIALLGAVVLLIILGALIKGRFALDLTVGLLTFFFASFGFILVLRGLLIGSPGAVKLCALYVVWPFIYLILVSGIVTVGVLRNLERTIMFSAALIGLLTIVYFLSQLKLLPEIPYFDSLLPEGDAAIGFYEGYIRMSLPGVNSLSFIVPFLMALVVTHSSRSTQRPFSIWWLWISLSLSTFVVIVSGRRASQLMTLFAPILIFTFTFFYPRTERIVLFRSLGRFIATLAAVTLLLVLLLRPVYSITFEGLLDRFSAGFDFSATSVDNSPDERRQQYFALERGWLEHPIFGAGLGEPAYGSIRSEETPWAYELSYLALLFQTGLVGLLTYASGIVWIYWRAAKILRGGGVWAQMILPLLVGLTCFLIANATNPYLAKFDGLWTIFLPVAAINLWLVQRQKASDLELRSS